MKIFCIGRNKTGTTSLQKEFKRLGYQVGHQQKAEKLLKEYINEDFESIIQYCKTADVFQDFPFSYPKTFQHLDKAYPNSKFILTIRNSPEEWYDSVIRFHTKILGGSPTFDIMKNHEYIWKGWIWEAQKAIYNVDETDTHNKKELIKSYKEYNESVLKYFKDKDNLLVLNLGEVGSYQKFLKFLNIQSPFSNFLHENRTK
jgi:hypothetical protein